MSIIKDMIYDYERGIINEHLLDDVIEYAKTIEKRNKDLEYLFTRYSKRIEVVRCGECVFQNENSFKTRIQCHKGRNTKDDEYCSGGVRKLNAKMD